MLLQLQLQSADVQIKLGSGLVFVSIFTLQAVGSCLSFGTVLCSLFMCVIWTQSLLGLGLGPLVLDPFYLALHGFAPLGFNDMCNLIQDVLVSW